MKPIFVVAVAVIVILIILIAVRVHNSKPIDLTEDVYFTTGSGWGIKKTDGGYYVVNGTLEPNFMVGTSDNGDGKTCELYSKEDAEALAYTQIRKYSPTAKQELEGIFGGSVYDPKTGKCHAP